MTKPSTGNTETSEAAVANWVRSTCAAQGIPERISDPRVLREVAALLGTSVRRSSPSP
ncbi:hypothetical protein V6N00_13320 [Tersicoccus sp. MR15.9]|uniref:hypothetical protein n=1 Tax=Tersicoccus mangrovi TaxID=3121635 RepID=UPI002FE5A3FF